MVGSKGWADVWWKGRFGWEYKGKHWDLKAAYQQLLEFPGSAEGPWARYIHEADERGIDTVRGARVRRAATERVAWKAASNAG